jgi:hypothetical protein
MSFRLHILLPVSREGKRGWRTRPAVPRPRRHRCRWDRRRQHLEAPRYGVVPPPPRALPPWLAAWVYWGLDLWERDRCCRLTCCLSLLGPRSVGEGCLGLLMFPPRGLHPFIKESFCCAQGVWDSDGPLLIFGIIRQEYILMVLVLIALNLCFF